MDFGNSKPLLKDGEKEIGAGRGFCDTCRKKTPWVVIVGDKGEIKRCANCGESGEKEK